MWKKKQKTNHSSTQPHADGKSGEVPGSIQLTLCNISHQKPWDPIWIKAVMFAAAAEQVCQNETFLFNVHQLDTHTTRL